MKWLINNIGNISVMLILLLIIIVIFRILIKDKKKGKSSCGCNCAHCALAGQCHKHSLDAIKRSSLKYD